MAQLGVQAGGTAPAIEAWASIGRILHPRIQEVAAYWDSKCRGRRAPSRRDIDPPFELRSYLPHLFMLDVVEPGPRFRLRLVGTEITRAVGGDRTGRFLDEVSPPHIYPELHQEIADVAANFVLRYRASDTAWLGRTIGRFHRLMAPLSGDQERVNIVFGVGYVIERKPRGRLTPSEEAALQAVSAVSARIAAAGPLP
jgi:hypothetical protein